MDLVMNAGAWSVNDDSTLLFSLKSNPLLNFLWLSVDQPQELFTNGCQVLEVLMPSSVLDRIRFSEFGKPGWGTRPNIMVEE